jgi:hypothetical protein
MKKLFLISCTLFAISLQGMEKKQLVTLAQEKAKLEQELISICYPKDEAELIEPGQKKREEKVKELLAKKINPNCSRPIVRTPLAGLLLNYPTTEIEALSSNNLEEEEDWRPYMPHVKRLISKLIRAGADIRAEIGVQVRKSVIKRAYEIDQPYFFELAHFAEIEQRSIFLCTIHYQTNVYRQDSPYFSKLPADIVKIITSFAFPVNKAKSPATIGLANLDLND